VAKFHISQLVQWTRRLFRGTQQALLDTAEAVKEDMKQEGAPVSYPIQWDSETQKRAYFATGGFGAGIPYQRTGGYEMGGSVEAKPYGAQFFNPHPAGAVGGTVKGWQSSIHRGRWVYLLDVIERAITQLPKRIREKVNYEEGSL
jgi:hypothetical protein